MRKLIYGINLTIDGCCDHTKVSGSDEIHEYFANMLHGADTLVYGRVTYQLMVPFWPDMAKDQSGPTKAINEFAKAFASVKNIVVFSRSLDTAQSSNTRIVRDNLYDEIVKLKNEKGKNILLGGVDVPAQLIQSGLVDEYYFVIHPMIVGEGRRLLADIALAERPQLSLVDSKIFPSGCVALHYVSKK